LTIFACLAALIFCRNYQKLARKWLAATFSLIYVTGAQSLAFLAAASAAYLSEMPHEFPYK